MRPRPLVDWLRRGGAALAWGAPAITLFLLTAPWPDTPDGLFHLHRVRSLAEALRMSVLFPRWFPDFAFGYGYPVLNFYAPLFYYPPALLHLAGLDVVTAVRITLAAFYALSGWATYSLLRSWTQPMPALLGSILYLLYPYRLYDLFVRGALPEFAAFLWPPLIAWATVRWLGPGQEDPGSQSAPSGWGVLDPGDRLTLKGADAQAPLLHGLRTVFRANAHAATGTTADENLRSDGFSRLAQPRATEVATTKEPIFSAASWAGINSGLQIFRADAHVARGATGDENKAEHPERRAVARSRRGGVVAGRPHPSTALRSAQDARDSIFRAGSLLLAALSWAGLILTHNLTALMLALISFAAAMVWTAALVLRQGPHGARGPSLARVWGWGLPLALGALLSGFYIVPALLEARWVGIGTTPEMRGYAAHFAGLGDLFDFALRYRYPPAAQPHVTAPGYLLLLLLMAGIAMLLPSVRGRHGGLATGTGIALAALWLTTPASAFVWDALAPLLGKLQFPWRWQAIVAFAGAATLAWTLDVGGQWLGASGRFTRGRPWAWGGALVLTAYLAFHAFGGLSIAPAAFTGADLTAAQMWAFDAEHGQVGASWTGEFLPRWVTEQRWAIGRAPSENVFPARPLQAIRTATVLAQNYFGERLRYTASAPGQLVYHAFYYPAWRVELDGQPLPAYPLGDLGLLAVDVPAGEHYVERSWGATPAVWAGRAGTALGWAIVSGLLLTRRTRGRWLRVGVWLGLALLAVVGGEGLLARKQTPVPVNAAYETVRLEAAVVTPARDSSAVPVTLYWLVTAPPEPLTAFIHLVAADGRMVAGDDQPLGGRYTPAERWQAGELLREQRTLPLPADLPPGAYRLLAGVYRPGAADKPLTPAGANPADPRVEIGVLEVRP